LADERESIGKQEEISVQMTRDLLAKEKKSMLRCDEM
jgi:hypothetical protein